MASNFGDNLTFNLNIRFGNDEDSDPAKNPEPPKKLQPPRKVKLPPAPLVPTPTPKTIEITWPRPWPTGPDPPRRLRLIEAEIDGLPAPDSRYWRSSWDTWHFRPRKWTLEELDIQNQIDDAYANGVRLWTREMLLFAEEEVARTDNLLYDFYAFNDPHTELFSGRRFEQEPWDRRSMKGSYLHPLVQFKGHRELTRPNANWEKETAWASWNPDVMLKLQNPQQTEDLQTSLDAFQDMWTTWQAKSTSSKGLPFNERIFGELPIPKDINKIVCFALGSISRELLGWHEDPDDLPPRWASHHLLAKYWAQLLEARFGHPVQLYAQEPDYNQMDRDVLTANGFKIVGMHGAEGFALVDRQTLVFSVYNEANTREIVYDLCRPAMMIMNLRFSGPPNEARLIEALDYEATRPNSFLKVLSSDGTTEIQYPNRTSTVTDTPRTIDMERTHYDLYEFWRFVDPKAFEFELYLRKADS